MRLSISILLASLAMLASAQDIKMTDLAPIEVKVSYELDQLCDYPQSYRNSEWREKQTLILEIGKGMAHSYGVKEHNKLQKQFAMKRDKNRWKLEFNLHALIGETFIGYPKSKELTQIVDLDVAGVYQYTEAVPKLNWKMTAERKSILGYDCQRATCTFRGRDYEAWFTTEIPLSYGPWKFQGLPGLILEVADTKNEYHFTATGIEQVDGKESIQIFEEEIRPIKRTRALKMEAMLHKDHGTFASDYGITFRMEGFEHSVLPYHPIELK